MGMRTGGCSLEANRLSSGYLNPESPQDAYKYNKSVLETVPYYLAISAMRSRLSRCAVGI